jgi:hypothetical protein
MNLVEIFSMLSFAETNYVRKLQQKIMTKNVKFYYLQNSLRYNNLI